LLRGASFKKYWTGFSTIYVISSSKDELNFAKIFCYYKILSGDLERA